MSQFYHQVTKLLPYGVKNRVNRARLGFRQNLTQLDYQLDRAYEQLQRDRRWWWWRLYVLRHTPILTYQMGKVGSASVFVSLMHDGHFSLHTHSFDAAWFDEYFSPQMRESYREYFPNWEWMRHHIIQADRHAKIITLVRDPVAINISFFFHVLDANTGVPNAATALTLDQLLEKYDQFQHSTYDYMLAWFQEEYHSHLGIDIFAHAFDKEAGYQRLSFTPYDILMMKLEMPDSRKAELIGDFLDIPDFTLRSYNTGEDKAYAEVYRAFKQAVVIPDEVLDRVYASPLAQHFYTEAEIEKFRAKWRRT